MARSQMRHNVKDTAGNVIQNALCYVYETGTVTAVDDMFAAATGGAAITTLTSNAQGDIEAWFDEARVVDIKVSDNTDAAYYPSQPTNLLAWADFTETVQVQQSGTSVTVKDEGVSTVAAASAIDFIGSAVAVSDVGSGVAAVTITSGAMTRIAQSVLGVAAASIDFSGIPATYETLVLELMGRGDTAATFVLPQLRFNNDSGANYDDHSHYAVGGGASPASSSNVGATSAAIGGLTAASATANKPGYATIRIPNYAKTVFQKVAHASVDRFESNVAGGLVTQQTAALWRSTAAINRITLSASAGNFIAGTVATLYGIS